MLDVQRDFHNHKGARPWPGFHAQGTAQEPGPLGHAGHTQPGHSLATHPGARLGDGEAPAVVGHREPHQRGIRAQAYPHLGRGGVLEHVGEGLLDDAIKVDVPWRRAQRIHVLQVGLNPQIRARRLIQQSLE